MMPKFTRRSFIAGAAAIPFAVWLEKLPNHYRPPAGSGRIDWEAILKDAPVTYAQTKTPLTYEAVIAALTAASDCRREDSAGYTVFDCASSKTRWYLTREGMPAHAAMGLMFSRSYVGGDEASYMLAMTRTLAYRTAPAPANGSRTPEEIAARRDVVDAWIAKLPGQENWNAPPPPLSFSLAGSPITEQDIQQGRGSLALTWDSALQKLTAAECARKDVGDYIAFTCKGSKLLFVLSAPTSPAHATLMIAEAEPGGRNMHPRYSRFFYDPAKPQTDEIRAAQNKWMRGIEYLPASQLR